MNKWVIILVVVTLAIGASSGVVFALTADGGGDNPGPVKDYVSLVDNLRAAGATVDPAGTESAHFLAPESQWLTVNGEDIQVFEFGSAEEADAAAGGVSANGLSIVTTMADGTQMATMVDWVAPAHFYKAGKLIVLYVGCDSDVINALQETMRPQFAGGEGPTQAPVVVPEPEVLPTD